MPPSHVTVVANPAAGGGKFPRIQEAFLEIMRGAGLTVRVHTSGRPGDCELLAQNAPRDTLVCAAGGDGTVSEVINGLRLNTNRRQETDLLRLAIFPCGTGNDFAMAVGLPEDPLSAARSFVTGTFATVDCGLVSWRGAQENEAGGEVERDAPQFERLFCNVVGMGMDAAAARRASGWKRWLGKSAYTAAAVATLAGWPQTGMRLVSGESGDVVMSTDRGLFVSVCNGPRSGGDFVLTPSASVADGRLDYCAVESPGFFRGLRLLPGVRHGRHVVEPEVATGNGTEFEVRATQPLDMHIDGELLDERVVFMRARVLPRAVEVLVGP